MYVALASHRLGDRSRVSRLWHLLLVSDSLVGLSARLQRAVDDSLKRRHLHVLVMVHLVQDVEGDDALRAGK